MTPSEAASHHETVRRAFTVQAPRWAEAWAAEVSPLLRWLVEHAEPRPDWNVLDVAAGTSLLGRALAPFVAAMTALDLTPAMLERGRQEAVRRGIANMRFVEGMGESLPYASDTFDLVATRFSFHHASEPEAILREMIRVCRPGGRVAVIDMLSPEDRGLADRYNDLERLRDPSHTWALTPAEWRALFDRPALALLGAHVADFEQDLDRWLQTMPPGDAPAAAIRDALEQELAGGPATGMRPARRDDRLLFMHTYAVVLTVKQEGMFP